MLDDAPRLTAVNRPESVLYTHLKSVFIVRSLHIMEGGEKKAPISHCGTEQLTKSFLSTDDAFTPALLHPVVWNGVNSPICHQMWQLYSHMVGPVAAVFDFTVTTLWHFKASAHTEM